MPFKDNASKTALVMFAGALVVVTFVAGLWIYQALRDSIRMRTETRSLLIAWQQVYSNLKDAETGARGYVLTAEDAYLEPFDKAMESMAGLLQTIAQTEGRIQRGLDTEKLASFQKLVDTFRARTRELITVSRREGRDNAIEVIHEGSQKKSMDDIRAFCESRLVAIDGQLRELDATMLSNLVMGGRSLAALGLAAAIAGLAAWAMLREALRHARRSEVYREEKQQSERANREKSTFLATMSHEIRTPMNAILGFGELIHSDARDEKQKRYAASIVRSGQALLQLINDILDLSKIEAGMLQISATPVNVREIADFTRQLFAHQCSAKGVELNTSVAEDVPASLLLDGARLRQIVLNLVGNAIKFTTTGHVAVRFRGERTGGQRSTFKLVLEVEDTGVGIPADRIDEIFDPFVQAKANRDTELKGTGLGLAIVKRLVTLMDGTVEVRSAEGKGTLFTVTLPHVEISARLPQALSIEQLEVDFNLLKPSSIFVVDDNSMNLAVVQGYFDRTHHSITTASNGREALEWLETHRPDVVLMDIRMPVMDGRTALTELRKRHDLQLLPVIAVTASSLMRDEDELRATFDGYVRKPYSRAQLFEELSHFIPRHVNETKAVSREDDSPVQESWTPLVKRLRELEQSEWPSVRDSMVMSQVSGFASQLSALGKSASCPPLELFAVNLQNQAESFSLDKLEKTLNGFPSLIAHLEKRVASVPAT